jgi:hypothetical protein
MKIMFLVTKETLTDKRMDSLLMKIKTTILLGHEVVIKPTDFSDAGKGQEVNSIIFDEAELLPSDWMSKLKGVNNGKPGKKSS